MFLMTLMEAGFLKPVPQKFWAAIIIQEWITVKSLCSRKVTPLGQWRDKSYIEKDTYIWQMTQPD